MDLAVSSYINQMVQWPVFSRVHTIAAVAQGEGDPFAIADVTPKGTFQYLLVRDIVLTYSANTPSEFEIFSANGHQVYASITAKADIDIAVVIPVWQLESSKIIIRSSGNDDDFSTVHFLVNYQEIYNDQKLWMNIHMKHSKAMMI